MFRFAAFAVAALVYASVMSPLWTVAAQVVA
jgi:hypothetical protein